MDDKILKELKELNKTLSSIRVFTIAEVQLTKSLALEVKKQTKDIRDIKMKISEEK